MMKQPDCMFIQVNETGYIYHLCYTDNTREVIARARFMELVSQTRYEDDDGVYWFRGNFWMFAQTPQDAPETNEAERAELVDDIAGYFETDAQWLARQEQLDYDATMNAASIYGQWV